MKVLNFVVDNKDSFTEDVIKDMFVKNIDFLLIKNIDYNEIHYNDSIVRYGSDGYLESLLHDMNFMAKMEELERDCVDDPFDEQMHAYFAKSLKRMNESGKY